ncbi:MAG: prepilin-type N-terminal cleavage/methylation domain-containing protein, partial [Minisyncoccia bacterium]
MRNQIIFFKDISSSTLRQVQDEASFTLIELLVVIGILGVLATAVVLVLNPAQLLAQARDS